VDSRAHQRAALRLQTFMQSMDGFDSGGVDQGHTAHGKDQGVCVTQICKGFMELTRRREEKWSRQKRDANVLAFACGLNSPLFEAFVIHFLHIDINAGDLVQEDRARQEEPIKIA
jgi:hypothetical protein